MYKFTFSFLLGKITYLFQAVTCPHTHSLTLKQSVMVPLLYKMCSIIFHFLDSM